MSFCWFANPQRSLMILPSAGDGGWDLQLHGLKTCSLKPYTRSWVCHVWVLRGFTYSYKMLKARNRSLCVTKLSLGTFDDTVVEDIIHVTRGEQCGRRRFLPSSYQHQQQHVTGTCFEWYPLLNQHSHWTLPFTVGLLSLPDYGLLRLRQDIAWVGTCLQLLSYVGCTFAVASKHLFNGNSRILKLRYCTI